MAWMSRHVAGSHPDRFIKRLPAENKAVAREFVGGGARRMLDILIEDPPGRTDPPGSGDPREHRAIEWYDVELCESSEPSRIRSEGRSRDPRLGGVLAQ